MSVLLALSRGIDWVNARLGVVACWLVLLSCLISAGNAASRYALSISSNAWLEIQWYMFSGIFLLGAAYTLKVNEHVRVDIVYGRLSGRGKVLVDLFGLVFFLMPVMGVMTYLSWPYFHGMWVSGEMSGNAGGLVRWPAVLTLPVISQPLGASMSDAAKQRLVEMLARRDIPLIEDDIYGELYFGPTMPRPAKAFDEAGLVMLCSSFTKTLAPGYRVGYAVPGRFRDQVEQLKFANSVATPTLPQLAIADFVENGGYEHHLRAMRRKLAAQVEQVSAAIAEHFPAGTRVSRPAGGFVLWVELPPGTPALELHARALAHGISVAPGIETISNSAGSRTSTRKMLSPRSIISLSSVGTIVEPAAASTASSDTTPQKAS